MLAPLPPDPLEWRPPPSLRERVLSAVGTPALVGVLIFLAALVSVVLLVLAQPHVPGELSAAASVATGPEDGWADPGSQRDEERRDDSEGSASGTSATGTVLVHVVGEVGSPGVVELPGGSRVVDAIAAAGGATPGAALDGVNLARIVNDGEQIVVPDPESALATVSSTPGVDGSRTGAVGAGIINLNSADSTALESLPRVGPQLAQRILEWRASNGRFTSIDDLLEVSGIGRKTLDGFRDQVTV